MGKVVCDGFDSKRLAVIRRALLNKEHITEINYYNFLNTIATSDSFCNDRNHPRVHPLSPESSPDDIDDFFDALMKWMQVGCGPAWKIFPPFLYDAKFLLTDTEKKKDYDALLSISKKESGEFWDASQSPASFLPPPTSSVPQPENLVGQPTA